MDHVQGKDLRRAMEEGETTGGPKDIGKTVNKKDLKGTESNN